MFGLEQIKEMNKSREDRLREQLNDLEDRVDKIERRVGLGKYAPCTTKSKGS